MKTLFCLLFSLLMGSAMAQTQIPEGGFENWSPNSTNVYFEPTGGWWTTLNSLATLGGPVTVSPTEDAHTGAYAAKMETLIWGDLLITGLLASGDFIQTPPYIRNGQPFTETPSKFKGWYKYKPVDGDSAGVAAFLTRYNTTAGRQDTLAEAVIAFTDNVETYTQFEVNFDYLIPDTSPDSLLIIMTSSGAGGDFAGAAGSTLIVDDLVLEYVTGVQESLLSELMVKVFPTPAFEQVTFQFDTNHPEDLQCDVYGFDGRLIQSFYPSSKEHQMDVSTWTQGRYILQVLEGSTLVATAKFIVAY